MREARGSMPLVLVLALALAACTTTIAPPAALASWEPLRPQAGEQTLPFDKPASRLRAYVFRAGTAARLGHNHVLSATDFEGQVLLGGTDLAQARLQLDLRLDRLQVDDPALRAELGGAFARPLDAEAVAGTRANMLGERGLQAAAHPLLRLRSLRLVGEAPRLAALVEIELHGQRRQQWLALRVQDQAQRLLVAGTLVLRQTDFGLQPFSLLGGLLAVADEIVVEFELALLKPSAAAAAKG
jgi:polyisoprenoid-binding protein YceI